MTTGEKMRFRRFGRSVHLQIDTAEDCLTALDLDEALWVASGAPVATVNCDATFLHLVDSDHDGRILCWELADAIRWATCVLTDHGGIDACSDSLSPSAVNADCPDGARIGSAIRKMLLRLGRPDDQAVALQEVRQFKAEVQTMPVSAVGVVLPKAAEDTNLRHFLADIIASTGGAPHPCGQPGVDAANLDAFLAAARACLDWLAKDRPTNTPSDICPLADRSAEAYEIYASLRGKIEQYFAQCQAAALDGRLTSRMGLTAEELTALDMDDPAAIVRMLADAPIARVRPDGLLHYDGPVNPYDAGRLAAFRRLVARPILAEDSPTLSPDQFRRIQQTFTPRDVWLAERPAEALLALGAEKLTAYLDERYAAEARRLIAASSQTFLELDNICIAEKAILYQANILNFVNNFVSFPHFYDPHRRAMFEMGSLIMDGRRFNLAVRVTDRPEHARVAASSAMFLMYVEVIPPAGQPKYEVAVPVTSGNKGNLCVGKRGLFCDLAGRECDARIVEIIENPISLTEAFVAPFVRIGRLLSGKIESITTSAEKKLDAQVSSATSQVAPAQPTAAPNKLAAGGMLMGAGVAAAAIGSALAYITKTLSQTSWITMLITVLVAVAAVLVPTTIVAMFKLRRRDLSAILEGSGWAINARMRLTRRQGRVFTRRPRLPIGAALIGSRRKRRIAIAAVVLIILALAGWLIVDRFVINRARPAPAAAPQLTGDDDTSAQQHDLTPQLPTDQPPGDTNDQPTPAEANGD